MSKNVDRPVVVVRGAMRTIAYAVRSNGSMPAKEFIESLDESDQRKIVALFQRMADHGTVPNPQQFKPVQGDIFEFKKHQIRVFCFREQDSWLLTNGYKKKKNRLDRAEIERARRVRTEHLARTRSRGSER